MKKVLVIGALCLVLVSCVYVSLDNLTLKYKIEITIPQTAKITTLNGDVLTATKTIDGMEVINEFGEIIPMEIIE